ncbi:MAG: hypothetical protein Q4B15_09200, partial [Lachnospiraceae bacterium]|nr:hypothetical protein [Lachnospiraceae bacterium]
MKKRKQMLAMLLSMSLVLGGTGSPLGVVFAEDSSDEVTEYDLPEEETFDAYEEDPEEEDAEDADEDENYEAAPSAEEEFFSVEVEEESETEEEEWILSPEEEIVDEDTTEEEQPQEETAGVMEANDDGLSSGPEELELDTSYEVKLVNGNGFDSTFTPATSGEYTLTISGSAGDSFCSLYKEGDYLESTDNTEAGAELTFSYVLIKGHQYKYSFVNQNDAFQIQLTLTQEVDEEKTESSGPAVLQLNEDYHGIVVNRKEVSASFTPEESGIYIFDTVSYAPDPFPVFRLKNNKQNVEMSNQWYPWDGTSRKVRYYAELKQGQTYTCVVEFPSMDYPAYGEFTLSVVKQEVFPLVLDTEVEISVVDNKKAEAVFTPQTTGKYTLIGSEGRNDNDLRVLIKQGDTKLFDVHYDDEGNLSQSIVLEKDQEYRFIFSSNLESDSAKVRLTFDEENEGEITGSNQLELEEGKSYDLSFINGKIAEGSFTALRTGTYAFTITGYPDKNEEPGIEMKWKGTDETFEDITAIEEDENKIVHYVPLYEGQAVDYWIDSNAASGNVHLSVDYLSELMYSEAPETLELDQTYDITIAYHRQVESRFVPEKSGLYTLTGIDLDGYATVIVSQNGDILKTYDDFSGDIEKPERFKVQCILKAGVEYTYTFAAELNQFKATLTMDKELEDDVTGSTGPSELHEGETYDVRIVYKENITGEFCPEQTGIYAFTFACGSADNMPELMLMNGNLYLEVAVREVGNSLIYYAPLTAGEHYTYTVMSPKVYDEFQMSVEYQGEAIQTEGPEVLSLDTDYTIKFGHMRLKMDTRFTPQKTGRYRLITFDNTDGSDPQTALLDDEGLNLQSAGDGEGSICTILDVELTAGTTYVFGLYNCGNTLSSYKIRMTCLESETEKQTE